jgi:8-oxo-dGTP pyrophosphatase MutT (NUDIX family)
VEAAPAPDRGRRAAVALVLRDRSGQTEVLLMRRAERTGDRWSGQIGLPGGHAEPGDPDLLSTALREAREEVGLELDCDARVLGHLPLVQAKARGRLVSLWITPYVFALETDTEPVLGSEATAAFWFPLARARAGEFPWTYRYLREGEELVLPAWRFEEHVVWGLTYEILSGFLRLAP